MPYFRADGIRIAYNWTDLTYRTLQAPINSTETGGPAAATGAWINTLTNAQEDPSPDPNVNCSGWGFAFASVIGLTGDVQSTIRSWTESFTADACDLSNAIYCFEQ